MRMTARLYAPPGPKRLSFRNNLFLSFRLKAEATL